MHAELADLDSLRSYLGDVRAALEAVRTTDPCAADPGASLADSLAEIERFLEDATLRLQRHVDAQDSARHASERRYRSLVEHSQAPILVTRRDRIVLANAAFAALVGADSVEAVLGRPPFDFVPAAGQEEARARIDRLQPGTEAVAQASLALLRLDGSTVDVDAVASSFEEDGEMTVHVVLLDVSERHRAEARLRHLTAVLDAVRRIDALITRERDPAALLRRSAQLLVESRGFTSAAFLLEERAGLRVAGAAGTTARTSRLEQRIAAGAPPPCVLRACAGEPVVIRDPAAECARCIGSDGAPPAHEVICLPLRTDERAFGALHAVLPHGVSGVGEELALLGELAADVAFALRSIELEAQATRAAASLREVRENFDALVATSPTAIITIDSEGSVTSWNRGAEELFGWSAEETVGRPVPFSAPGNDAETRALQLRALAGESLSGLEVTHRRRDGSAVDVAVSSFVLRGADGSPSGLLGLFTDVTARRQAERALRVSEERLRTEFELASAGRCLTAPDGRILKMNRSLAEMLGGAPELFTGRTVETLIHPEDRGASRAARLSLLAGERATIRRETRYLRRDGAVIWLDVGTALQRDAAGAPVHFITDAQDVTARRRAEEESRERGERLARLAKVVSDLAGARTRASVSTVVLAAARYLIHAEAASFALRGSAGAFPWADVDGLPPPWSGLRVPLVDGVGAWVMEHREPIVIEDLAADQRFPLSGFPPCPIRGLAMAAVGRKEVEGAIGAFWTSPHRASSEELSALQALADATSVALANVNAYDELRRSQERYRSLVENLDDVVYSIDTTGRITYVSDATLRFGYAREEVIGQPFLSYVHPDDRERVEQTFRERLVSDLPPVEFRLVDGEGKPRFIRSSLRRTFEGARLLGMSGVILDLTELRQTEALLRGAQKMEAIGRLAGGVAHDFNNILTVVSSYATLAQRRLSADDPLRGDIEEIRNAGDRATALTRQLLAFSRRQVLQPAVLDLDALVAGVEKMLRRLIGEDFELVFLRGADRGRFEADPGQVEQVLMNLVVNARDAMPSGGRIVVETKCVELEEAFAERDLGVRPGPHLLVSVSDTGCGMDAATRERLFEPFFTTKPPGMGTGLGLATSYGIVKQSGGAITATSEVGRGSTFRVYFPRVEAPARTAPRTVAPVPTRAARGTILLVEDDEALRSLTRRILLDAGFEILAASSAEEALAHLSTRGGDLALVLTDVVLPGMSGRELARRIAASAPRTRILFMSGYGDQAIGNHGVLEPGTLLLAKPFTPEALLARIHESLEP